MKHTSLVPVMPSAQFRGGSFNSGMRSCRGPLPLVLHDSVALGNFVIVQSLLSHDDVVCSLHCVTWARLQHERCPCLYFADVLPASTSAPCLPCSLLHWIPARGCFVRESIRACDYYSWGALLKSSFPVSCSTQTVPPA